MKVEQAIYVYALKCRRRDFARKENGQNCILLFICELPYTQFETKFLFICLVNILNETFKISPEYVQVVSRYNAIIFVLVVSGGPHLNV